MSIKLPSKISHQNIKKFCNLTKVIHVMKGYLLLLLLPALCCVRSYAQQSPAMGRPPFSSKEGLVKVCFEKMTDSSTYQDDSVYLPVKALSMIDQNSVQELQVMNHNADANSNKKITLLVRLKRGVHFLDRAMFLKRYKIPRRLRNLPICINHRLLEYSGTFYIDASLVKRVNITGEILDAEMIRYPGQRYINIVIPRFTGKSNYLEPEAPTN